MSSSSQDVVLRQQTPKTLTHTRIKAIRRDKAEVWGGGGGEGSLLSACMGYGNNGNSRNFFWFVHMGSGHVFLWAFVTVE